MIPDLKDLPPPPPGKHGWPWTEAASLFPCVQPNGSLWPKVSIVTPSYNQAFFLEETLRSVLLQGYPDLEFIVLDGGSTDGSVQILEKYSPFLSYWHSQKDSGQSAAINQGLRIASGELAAWLNSDDTYLPGMLLKAVPLFAQREVNCVYGNAYFADENSQIYDEYPAHALAEGWKRMCFWEGWPIPQPTVLFRRNLLSQYGFLDESLRFGLDYELFTNFMQHTPFHFIDEYLAIYRVHHQAKSGNWSQNKIRFYREDLGVNFRYASPIQPKNWPLWGSFTIYLVKAVAKRMISRLARIGE